MNRSTSSAPSSALATPVRPDYDGAWIGGLIPALFEAHDPSRLPDWLPAPVAGARAVVLLVIDGLGWASLTREAGLVPVLSGLQGRAITTTVPSTTATALTSIACAAPPSLHGVTGYRMRVGGRGLNVLRWQAGVGDAVPEPREVQPLEPFLGRAVPVVTRAEFRSTGFTVAHLRGTRFTGWRTTSALLEHVRRLVAEGETFVYAYYDGVDKVAHEFGLASPVYATELVLTDRLVADLLARLPADAALVVTADHGQVEVGPAGAVGLGEVRRMVAAFSGEGRFRGLHARTGMAQELEDACREHYSDRAWVLSREQLFDEGWLGPGAGLAVRGRVGDVLLAAHAPVVFVDPGHTKEADMISQHGSITAAEMQVPLLAGRGTGA